MLVVNNRISDGKYTFNNKHYQLDINEIDRHNAIHGLVYNKAFKVIENERNPDEDTLTLNYQEQNPVDGFPFTYDIILKYQISQDSFSFSISIKNTDSKAFPFTLGWHPYFKTTSIDNSTLEFESHRKVIHNQQLIGVDTCKSNINLPFEIPNKLDDCYIISSDKVKFKTPTYEGELTSKPKINYLQLYKPQAENALAIEPMTGYSDSFNHKSGLQVLESGQVYNLRWTMKFIN